MVLLQENCDFNILGPKCGPGGSKMASRGLPGASWSPGRALEGQRGSQKSEKYTPGRPRGGPEEIFRPVSAFRGGPEEIFRSVLGLFWLPLGWFLGLCLAVFLAIPKISFFANTLSENSVFEAPGESFSEPFSSQNGTKKCLRLEMDPSGHRNHIKSAAGRSWRPPGAEKQTLEILKTRWG